MSPSAPEPGSRGEIWAREVLAELRRDRFHPFAWVRFLRKSFEFAAERRAERPREHRVTLVLGFAGVAAWAIALAVGHPLLALAGAAWWILATLMLDWHLGMLESRGGRPVAELGLANVLTHLRGGTAPAIAVLFGSPAGIALLGVAGASDVVDGWLARRRGEVTRLGAWLDGAVDGLVLGAAALGAFTSGRAPVWLLAIVLARITLPWLTIATVTFARAETPNAGRAVPGRIPGLVLFAGLALLAFDAGAGVPVAAAGAAGGLGTFALTIARSARPDSRTSGSVARS